MIKILNFPNHLLRSNKIVDILWCQHNPTQTISKNLKSLQIFALSCQNLEISSRNKLLTPVTNRLTNKTDTHPFYKGFLTAEPLPFRGL